MKLMADNTALNPEQQVILNQLPNLEGILTHNPTTDSQITIGEIRIALCNLKNGKAAGPDLVLNEILKKQLRLH